MLIVDFKEGTYADVVSASLMVGDSADHIELLTVESVFADKEELALIISWGLPDCKKHIQSYYGDMARYIVANWGEP